MKEIPLEYTPLSINNLEVGMEFGPLEFTTKISSHIKSKSLLEESDVNGQTHINSPYLFPSEMWGWARVFSSYFGRLNEVAVSKAKWDIFRAVNPGENLVARSKVLNVEVRKNIPFTLSETITEDKQGKRVISCLDELILLHDVDFKFYVERGKESDVPFDNSYDRTRRVYFRHEWDNGKWINNIHTNKYAQKFGYEKGIPEFNMYMDWIFLSELERFGGFAYKNVSINIEKILPIYSGEEIRILGRRVGEKNKVQFFRKNQERLRAIISK